MDKPACKRCGSHQVYYRNRKNEYVCKICGAVIKKESDNQDGSEISKTHSLTNKEQGNSKEELSMHPDNNNEEDNSEDDK